MRKTLPRFLVVLLPLAGCAGQIEDRLGANQDDIVGGAAYTGLPAVGALTVDGEMYCSGTLVAPTKVVTAAHCVIGVSASQMAFVIGPKLSQAQEIIQAAALKAHPNYDDYELTDDIATVTLSKAASVEPLGVNQSMNSSWVGKSLLFVGYGVNNGYTQAGDGTKRAVNITLSQIMAKQFQYDDTKHMTCNGDSGGPAFAVDADGKYLLAGVTSYGDYYCAEYGVDTRVDTYLDFIGVGSGGEASVEPNEPATSCAHSFCATGAKLASSCDPCVEQICAKDSYCCKNKWDKTCVGEVASICGQTC